MIVADNYDRLAPLLRILRRPVKTPGDEFRRQWLTAQLLKQGVEWVDVYSHLEVDDDDLPDLCGGRATQGG